jgi:predicted metal-binding protein
VHHADGELTSQASQLQTGALFKVFGWAGQTHDAGTVHRSPRMEGSGLVRLVLVLDLPPGNTLEPLNGNRNMTTEILVCVSCRPANWPSNRTRPGRNLLEAVENLALRDDAPFFIRPVECMSGCQRSCTVALQAVGKTSYFFGDLPADEVSAEQILACAALHQASPDGFLSRDARPERLRAGILARLPNPLASPVAMFDTDTTSS